MKRRGATKQSVGSDRQTRRSSLHLTVPASERAFTTPLAYRDFDFSKLIAAFRRRILLFAGVLLAVCIVGAFYTLQLEKRYTSSSQLLIDPRERRVLDFDSVLSGLPSDPVVVDTEVELLNSLSLARRVADKLDLYTDPEFNTSLAEPGLLSSVVGGLTSIFRSSEPDAINEIKAREKTVKNVLAAFNARRVGLTQVILVQIESLDPEKSRVMSNAFANEYILRQLETKFQATEQANKWLYDRLEKLRDEVSEAETAMESYRSELGLIGTNGTSLAQQQISTLNKELVIERGLLARARATLDNAEKQVRAKRTDLESIAEVLRSPVVAKLREAQTDWARRESEILTRYRPRHPQAIEIKREGEELQAQIDLEISRILASLRNDTEVAAQRVQSLEDNLAQTRRDLNEQSQAFVGLRELERNAEASRSLYESVLARAKQTADQDDLTHADARVITEATLPMRPSSPNVPVNLGFSFILGLMLAGSAVAFAEMQVSGLRSGEELANEFDLPCIAEVPKLGDGLLGSSDLPFDTVAKNPTSAFAEAYRACIMALRMAKTKYHTPRLVAIASSVSDEGKTTSALCLGRVAAYAGARTIVIDTDFRRPGLEQSSGLHAGHAGIMDVLHGRVELEDAVMVDQDSGLHILPHRQSQVMLNDVYGTREFDEFLRELRETYDHIFVDTAPLLAISETQTLLDKADATFFVVRAARTPKSELRKALALLESMDANVVGGILTQVGGLSAQPKSLVRTMNKYYNLKIVSGPDD